MIDMVADIFSYLFVQFFSRMPSQFFPQCYR